MVENQTENTQMRNQDDERPKTPGETMTATSEGSLGGGMLLAPDSRPEKPGSGVPPPALIASNDSNPAAEPQSANSQVEVSQAKAWTKPSVTPISNIQGSEVTQQESLEENISSATETGTVASETSSKASSSNKEKKSKKDRSKLRKGKWTPEEEEYTSRIIHYFSSGILTLPEGTTIRGYLADKLNCDPMRITKKYAGAACLGKRVYHFVDRPPATVDQVEMAKVDLAQLEQRFRLRVEHGRTGIPIPPRNDLLPDPNNSSIFASAQMHNFLQNLSATAPGAFASAPSAATVAQTPVRAPAAFPGALLPFFNPNALVAGVVPGMPIPQTSGQNHLAALAWAQAAASLSPAISQLAVANLQQQQHELQKAFEARLQEIAKQQTVGNAATTTTTVAPTSAPVEVQKIQATTFQAPPSVIQPMQLSGTAQEGVAQAPVSAKPAPAQPTPQSPRSKEDEDAGSMLMGFLSSLRKGYEEALSEREQSEGKLTAPLSGHKRERRTSAERAETESGTTSYPAESSLEDSDEAGKSNKQTCSSSEGDSDKESSERESSGERGSSSEEGGGSVPPRKRMKGKHSLNEFTRQNVAEHNHRMDVMRLGKTQQDPSKLGAHWPRDGRTND